MVEQLAISIISQPDLRLFVCMCVCVCEHLSLARVGVVGCFAVVPQQLSPSNFKKNKHSLVAGGKLRGAETSGKIKSLVAPSLV